MKAGAPTGAETDQFRVFKFITERLLQSDKPLRLMVQASAGTTAVVTGPVSVAVAVNSMCQQKSTGTGKSVGLRSTNRISGGCSGATALSIHSNVCWAVQASC